MVNNAIEMARKRYQELSTIIEEADKVRAEHTQLESFFRMEDLLAQKYSPKNGVVPETNTSVNSNGHKPSIEESNTESDFMLSNPAVTNLSIPDRAEVILKERGPLYLSELFKQMRQRGWKATGDDSKDKKNLAASLFARKKRFLNIGNNTWDVVKK